MTTDGMTDRRHWQLSRDARAIAWLSLDCAASAANTLGSEVLAELGALLDALEREPPAALVIRSGKAAGFIAGADVAEFTRLVDGAAVRALLRRGWTLFERIEALPFPTLALIRGHCMGGGLELALACRYRLAVDEPATRLALPEVMLGIVPGWGGMRRLPRLVGPGVALDMMLSGRQIDARRALKMGLVDACVPPRVMDNAAAMLVTSGRPAHRAGFAQRLLNGPLRFLAASAARRQVAKKARRELYPAPWAILDTWQLFDGDPLAVPPQHSASFEHLFAHGTAMNLVRVFFLQQRLKGLGKEGDFTARRVHVVGAGVMGGDIAAWCVQRGLTVTLQDQGIERIAPAIARAAEGLSRKFRGDRTQVRLALDRLIADPQGYGVSQADVIIEAIFENLDAKHALFRDLEKRARPDAILATNTSSLRLEDIGSVLRDPARLVGIHFFNPVAKMPLVEVVTGVATAPELARRAMAFVRKLDKLPLPVRSAPGFLVNAVLGPYLLEAMRCVDQGVAPATLDAAMERFGMPMGPLELADMVGLDILMATGRALTGTNQMPACLRTRFEAGKLGRKSGEGFYPWPGGRVRKPRATGNTQGLAERLVACLLQAARDCVQAGVVADDDLADAGVIFGTGFAPWTGGPLNYAKSRSSLQE